MYLSLIFASLTLIGLLVILGDFLLRRRHKIITPIEDLWIAIGAVVVSAVLAFTVYTLGTSSMLSDTQILNGKVFSKEKVRVGCRHSYSCHCRTVSSGSGKNRTTYTQCDTCYEHSFDNDWDVHSSFGTTSINTVDSQGLTEPPRWTATVVGEPFSVTNEYTNYVKASPQSLFNSLAHLAKPYVGKLPLHEISVYDYWHTNRVIMDGVYVPDSVQLNDGIAELLKDIGVTKQVNLVVVFTKDTSSLYSNALQSFWLGGKKNEAVLVIGTPKFPEISWVSVFSWSKNDLFNVKLRDDIRNLGVYDRDKILYNSYADIVTYFKRKPMEDYKYLENEYEPEVWVIVLALLLGAVPLALYVYRYRFL